ncbi:hypothetical protein BJG93_28465 (plasmid) [Paraburkholderia sprentiae WSM5005]|uniref:Uncharacterized protein n=1 Tax=Paraburkholderia sprentiae WSM5005 TaxID=754502 RepID=A0ACA8AUX3_9BURK|nr:hypothetical protein [Paraburkholderia sprentiae]APA89441.1 hypothetical protein BJG93_28465 [Paraburkholderia sprentiae WSM5005]
MLVAISMLAGGGLAGALGYNAQGAATAAENETLNNYLNHWQVQSLLTTLKGCAQGDTSCVSQTVANYQSISTQQQQAAQNCNSTSDCQQVQYDAMQSGGVSEADIEAAWQGGTKCTQFMESLANQASSAKSIATSNWNSVSNAVAQQNQYQAMLASSGSSTWATMFAAISPLDVSGAVDGITGLGSRAPNNLVSFSLPNGSTIEGVPASPSLAPGAPTSRYQITSD